MPRYALKLEYDGGPFAGWQAQADLPTVQGTLEGALARIDGGFAAGARVAAAGRTDAGVHATGQVAHADLVRAWAPQRLADALNAHLRPAPVAVTAAAAVEDEFHARFSATGRRYTFRILNRRAPPVLDAGRVWHIRQPLNPEAMRAGAAALVGRHDFTTFRAALCQAASPVRTLDAIEVEVFPLPEGQDIRLHFRARSFLHNQVRSMVGTLERAGAGAWPPSRVADALAARDRSACGPVCPPSGLCLTGVSYPSDPFAAGHDAISDCGGAA